MTSSPLQAAQIGGGVWTIDRNHTLIEFEPGGQVGGDEIKVELQVEAAPASPSH
jgi:hypothetical protein